MESPNRLLLLAAALSAALTLTGCQTIKGWFGKEDVEPQQTEDQAAAEEEAEDTDATPPRVIEPNVARRKIKTPKIDNENWEIGVGAGFLSIEDFGTNPSYAGQITYHVTEDFFFRGDLGQSTAGKTSFERLGGDIELLTGDQRLTLNLGAGFRVLPTDWLAIHLAVQDRVFDSDLLGETKVTNNIEMLL